MCRPRQLISPLALALALAIPIGSIAVAPAAEEPMRPSDVVPRPDPTLLTTANLLREVSALQRDIAAAQKLLESQIEGLEKQVSSLQKILETRIDGMDKAINLLQSRSDKLPADIDVKISSLERLFNEKFKSTEASFSGIQLQFKERDERVIAVERSTTTNIASALQAQKEQFIQQNISFDRSTQKSENTFAEQIKQMGSLIQTETRSLDGKITTGAKVADDKIADLSKRLTTIESIKQGEGSSRQDQNMSSTLLIAIIGIIVSIIAVGVAMVMAFRKQEQHSAGGTR